MPHAVDFDSGIQAKSQIYGVTLDPRTEERMKLPQLSHRAKRNENNGNIASLIELREREIQALNSRSQPAHASLPRNMNSPAMRSRASDLIDLELEMRDLS